MKKVQVREVNFPEAWRIDTKEIIYDTIREAEREFNTKVLCLSVAIDQKVFELKTGYTHEDEYKLDELIDKFFCNRTFLPKIEGIIWFNNGMWATRHKDKWILNSCPQIPSSLKSNVKIINIVNN